MKEKSLKIIEHFGVNNQQRKLQEEVFELQEAITKHENKNPIITAIDTLNKAVNNINGKEYKMFSIKNIEEEFADVMVLLEQFKVYYNLDNKKIIDIMEYKTKRQLERMKNE